VLQLEISLVVLTISIYYRSASNKMSTVILMPCLEDVLAQNTL